MDTEYKVRSFYDLNGELVQRSIFAVKAPSYKNLQSAPDEEKSSKTFTERDFLAESRRRAFSLASLKLSCNPDMTCFITLTYDPKRNESPDYLNDIKNLMRGTGTKYLATFERHKKNPLLHIHLITTPSLETFVNDNGYLSLKRWHRGFSSVKMISDFDDRFRVAKYIFKYMNKSEKVKHKYVYSSRGLVGSSSEELHSLCYIEKNIDLLMEGLHYQVGMLNLKYKVIKGVRQ